MSGFFGRPDSDGQNTVVGVVYMYELNFFVGDSTPVERPTRREHNTFPDVWNWNWQQGETFSDERPPGLYLFAPHDLQFKRDLHRP
jgi:hypothetical protein